MAYGAPEESNLSKQAVDKLASGVARQLKFEPGHEIEPVVAKLGGRIEFRDLSEVADPSSGSIRIEGDGKFAIFLPSHTGPARNRFTIAHELGHLVLHFMWPRHQNKMVGPIEARRYGTGRVEWEANWFAAGFLMPAEDFRQHAQILGNNTTLLAARYDVSPMAVDVRIQSLNLR